ncbi:MAG TPA: DNA repair protein RadC [Clostridiales bacterium]|nr:MAG: hypothetical protein BWY37_01377 [Firmicutes bacterium ADurb.Bin262]HOU09469.1 DNA repair protein RadC [Clostridiales bacterium]HQK72959.1 DNA repair protein RadC [Clostridiales bacterium]
MDDQTTPIKNPHEYHRERMRLRYIEEMGFDSFEDHQVLEMLLFHAVPRRDTNALAHALIGKYGSLAGVFEADPLEMAKVKGMTKNAAVLVTMLPDLMKRYQLSKYADKPVLGSVEEAGEYVKAQLCGKDNENFFAICVNAQNKVINAVKINEGTVCEVAVYPQKVAEAALRFKARSIILAHNHPGGSLTPSQEDIELTRSIEAALRAVGVKLNDHIISAGDQFVSLKRERYI